MLVGLIGDPITDVTPVYAWVHTLIVDAMDRYGLHRDLVPVVGAGRKCERSCRGRGRWQRCPWSHVGCREEGRGEEDKKGRRMGSVRIGRENCWVWLRDRDLHPPSLSIRQGSEVVYSQTHFGVPIAFEKAKNSPKNPLVKAEVIRDRLILALRQHECIPVPVVGTPLMDDLLVQHLFQN